MKLTVLVDNSTFIDRYFIAEPAVSFFVEADGKKILFDAGYSDVFITNAQKLGIDLLDVDMVVLSHGHLDHTWGLTHLIHYFSEKKWLGNEVKRPILIAHPIIFASRSFESDPEIGSLLKEETLKKFFDIQLTKKPLQLSDKLTFMGEIERANDFEAQKNIGMVWQNGKKIPDMVMDDSALVCQAKEGLVIITGCSHAGICNILEQARIITGQSQVVDVVGGFHLLNPSLEQMNGTKTYLSKLKPSCIHACHCTDLKSKIELSKVVNLKEVGVGLTLNYS